MANLIEPQLRERAAALLAEGVVDLFLGYRHGSSPLRMTPYTVRTPADAERLAWNGLCVPNLAGSLQKHAGKRIGLALKGCDARSVAELIRLHQVDRRQLYIIGVACDGMADPERIAAVAAGPVDGLVEADDQLLIESNGTRRSVARADLLLTKCATCSPPLVQRASEGSVSGRDIPMPQIPTLSNRIPEIRQGLLVVLCGMTSSWAIQHRPHPLPIALRKYGRWKHARPPNDSRFGASI
jgi:hypothetical protein